MHVALSSEKKKVVLRNLYKLRKISLLKDLVVRKKSSKPLKHVILDKVTMGHCVYSLAD